MEPFKQKRIAVVCCILLVVAALLLGSHRSLTAERQKVMELYISGDETGLSILSRLDSISEYAVELVKSVGAYCEADDQNVEALRGAYKVLQMSDRQDVETHRFFAGEILDDAVRLQTALEGRTDVPEETLRAVRRSVVDITSAKDQIGHSGYNEAAAQFNDLLQAFPMDLLASLTGVRPLKLF